MSNTTPREGKPGTTDQWPRWEGPEETRPRGYLPANDDPATDRDAAGENLNDPDRRTLGDAVTMKEDKAGELPPFDDPAHSSRPADSPVQQDASAPPAPPKDTEYAGHPEFSQDAAANKPPNGMGNSEPAQETEDHARHSEGVNPKYPSPQQNAGARHSRDS